MVSDDVERIYASDGAESRAWMAADHATAAAVWLVFYKKDSGKPSVSWSLLDGPHALLVPEDFAAALGADPAAARGYEPLSDSAKRGILEWIALAKRPETRARRIAKAVSETAVGRSPLG